MTRFRVAGILSFLSMIKAFRNHLQRQIDLNDEDWDLLEKRMKLLDFKKGQVLHESGKPSTTMYFVVKGAARSFLMKDGEEITWNFYFPGGIATDFQSYLNGKATPLSFVALDKTQVIALTKAEINALYLKHPHLMRLETLFSEGAFLDMRRRVESFHLQSAEERYLSLIENNATLVKKLPNKDIATYLGIAPQSLSRIKRRLFKTH